MKIILAVLASIVLSLTGCAVVPAGPVVWGGQVTVAVGTPVYPVYGYGYPPAYAYPVPIRQDCRGNYKTLPTPGMRSRY